MHDLVLFLLLQPLLHKRGDRNKRVSVRGDTLAADNRWRSSLSGTNSIAFCLLGFAIKCSFFD